MKTINVILCLFTLVGSGAIRADVDTSKPVIIFLPGLYGSFLRDISTKKRIWVTAEEALFGHDTVSLYQKELQTPAAPDLEIDGVNDKVVVIPGVYEIDVYGEMMDSLKAIPGYQLVPFDYDWRQDLHDIVVRLDDVIGKLQAQGVKQIDLVGHSGGALTITYYLAYGTQQPETAVLNWAGAKKIRRAAIMGAPLKGSFNIFRDMTRGSTLPMMGHMLPGDTISSFPFLYMTLPYMTQHAVDEDGKSIPFTLSDPSFWQKNMLGLLSQTDLPSNIMKNRADFISQKIVRGHKYMDLLESSTTTSAPSTLKVLNVIGHGTATTDAAYYVPRGHGMELYFDTDDLASQELQVGPLQVDGDGMVTAYSAATAPYLKSVTHEMSSSYEHDKIVEDKDVQKAIVAFLTAH